MDNSSLQQVFQCSFRHEDWIRIVFDIFGAGNKILTEPKELLKNNDDQATGYYLGSFNTSDGYLVGLFRFCIDASVVKRPVGLRKLVERYIKNEYDLALVVFDDGTHWRFSFISDLKGATTTPKRYTYTFGDFQQQYRTPIERFLKLQANRQNRTAAFKEMQEAFSVDALTKEFYTKLSQWYFWALSQVKFPGDLPELANEQTRNATMTIRLITRIIFVWFLKKKGIVPEKLFNKETIARWLNGKDSQGSTYYKAILQNLFFATLNLDPKESPRGFRERQWGSKSVLAYRYKRFFHSEMADEFVAICQKIPFLNGGLFENLDKEVESKNDCKRVDCFSDLLEEESRLRVPDELFFGEERTVDLSAVYGDPKKKKCSVQGLFPLLNSYNFTIEEDTPYEKNVALDPELLGRIFENLLASYNPETAETARKTTGSYYTPREIVQYMVNESIIAFLNTQMGSEHEEEYRKLTKFQLEETTLNEIQKKKMVEAIFSCRILDPACGSGAFPIGVLQQLVHLLNQIDPDNNYLKELVCQQVIGDHQDSDRAERLATIDRIFDTHLNSPDYARKLYLIEQCIYGVDIQPIAVQITKLRFFISLIIEQQENVPVLPLPNLETNIVAANTLIGKAKRESSSLFDAPEIRQVQEELQHIRHQHFSARTTSQKEKLRKKDQAHRTRLAEIFQEQEMYGPEDAKQLAEWNPYDQNASSPFFDPEWMFGIKDRFDIVIGNPPYGVIKNSNEFKNQYEKEYKILKSGRLNIYQLFFGLAKKVLAEYGVCAFIHPKTLLSDTYLAATRNFLLSHFTQATIIDIVDRHKTFENVLQSVVVSLWHNIPSQYKVAVITQKSDFEKPQYLDLTKNQFATKFGTLLVADGNGAYQIAAKMLHVPSMNTAFVTGTVEWNKVKELLGGSPFPNGARLLFAENIQRFELRESNLRDDKSFLKENNLPTIANTCIITQRTTAVEQPRRIIATLINPTDFSMPIVCENHTNVYILSTPIVCENNTNVYCISNIQEGKYILGILTSKLMDYYFRLFNSNTHVASGELNRLPIAIGDSINRNKIIELVDRILLAKSQASFTDTSELEREIDQLVYTLYGLTEDEIKIVEGVK